MSENVIVKAATAVDLPQVAKIAQEVYRQTFGDEMDEADLTNALEERSLDYFKKIISKDVVLVAEIEKSIVGFIQFGTVSYDNLETKEEDVELNKIYVDRGFHGKGVGKKLIEGMLSHERVKPTSDLYLDVYAKNDKATGLYKKYGFREIGKVPFKVDGKVVGYDVLMKRSSASKAK